MRCEKYRQLGHLMENCDDHGGGVTVVGECDSHKGGVTGIRNGRLFMEMCNSNVGGVTGCGEV